MNPVTIPASVLLLMLAFTLGGVCILIGFTLVWCEKFRELKERVDDAWKVLHFVQVQVDQQNKRIKSLAEHLHLEWRVHPSFEGFVSAPGLEPTAAVGDAARSGVLGKKR